MNEGYRTIAAGPQLKYTKHAKGDVIASFPSGNYIYTFLKFASSAGCPRDMEILTQPSSNNCPRCQNFHRDIPTAPVLLQINSRSLRSLFLQTPAEIRLPQTTSRGIRPSACPAIVHQALSSHSHTMADHPISTEKATTEEISQVPDGRHSLHTGAGIPDKTVIDIANLDEASRFIHENNVSDARMTELAQDTAGLRRLRTRTDLLLLPLLCGTYFLQFIDKQAMGYGAVFDLFKDTGTTINEYSWLVSVFIPETLCQVENSTCLFAAHPMILQLCFLSANYQLTDGYPG